MASKKSTEAIDIASSKAAEDAFVSAVKLVVAEGQTSEAAQAAVRHFIETIYAYTNT